MTKTKISWLRLFWKKFPLFCLCFAIVGGCLFLTFKHYTSFGGKNDVITQLETSLLDLRFLLRGQLSPKSKVGVLAIDEKAINQFGQWPISRRYYKQALINLKKLGVRWVGFDAVFSEPERVSLEDARLELDRMQSLLKVKKGRIGSGPMRLALANIRQLQAMAPGDQAFADGIEAFENVVLGYFYFQSPKEVASGGRQDKAFQGLDQMAETSRIEAVILPEGQELSAYPDHMKAFGLAANIPLISRASAHFAFFSNEADNDAIVRWVTQVRIIDGQLMPSLSLKIAAEAMKRDILVIFDKLGVEAIELVSREDESDAISIPIDPYGQGRVLANYKGPGQSYPHFSLADAYHNSFSQQQKEQLQGAVLLMGMTAIGINDQRPNPFDPAFDGVEIHATVADNILSQDFLHRPKSIFNWELAILLAIGVIFSPILIFSRASFAGLLGLGFAIGYYYFDKYYWFNQGVWAYMAMPYIEISSLFISITLYKYVIEEREKRKVKGAFAHYLSPEVINQVLDEPDSLQLGGVKKELTVFFSDVRSFTTISESLSPERLCEFMNQYFTPMTSIILSHKGVLDKYIGDAIMAFWGAPIPLVDQADIAAEASIAMLLALDKLHVDFQAKGFPRCDIGIGLNTGPMSVGNMGSDERFCYTVMGDAVNLGSRLEGLTKEYGVKILISEFTVARFTRKHHLVRDLDDIRVKGKNKPIKVFELMRPDKLPQPQQLLELIGLFSEGRAYYQRQDWHNAGKKFAACLALAANDGPSLLYQQRVEAFKVQPPASDWDGVFTFDHK